MNTNPQHHFFILFETKWSKTTKVNNIDHFITMQCSAGKTFGPWIHVNAPSLNALHPSKHCCRPSAPTHARGLLVCNGVWVGV